MASKGVNKVIIVGNLGQDPEVRFTQNGSAIANLSIATSESWKDQQGQMQEKTEWHRVAIFGKTAEVAGEYLRKGSQVYIEGKLQTRKWQDQSGQDRYTTEVVVQPYSGSMQMLGGRGGDGGNAGGGYQRPQGGQNQGGGRPQQGGQGGYGNQGGYQQQPAQQPAQQPQSGGFNQAPQGGAPQPATKPMDAPDFDFDDDIPF